MSPGKPLIFGEVLFDCFPDGREVLGGAPFNVAWNLQAFGLKPVFVSRVGEDSLGRKIREKMASWGMDTNFLQSDPDIPTGKVEITLSGGEPNFAILPNQAYDKISRPQSLQVKDLTFLYHGSLALRDTTSRNTCAELKQIRTCPVFLDVNLRNPWWDRELVLSLIEGATWLKLNDVECRTLFPENEDLHTTCRSILESYNLQAVFLTLGSKGAVAFLPDNEETTVQPSNLIKVEDTVGAGDAFSSVLLLGLVNKWPMETTLTRAQDFASAIVMQRGATLQDPEFYTNFKETWT